MDETNIPLDASGPQKSGAGEDELDQELLDLLDGKSPSRATGAPHAATRVVPENYSSPLSSPPSSPHHRTRSTTGALKRSRPEDDVPNTNTAAAPRKRRKSKGGKASFADLEAEGDEALVDSLLDSKSPAANAKPQSDDKPPTASADDPSPWDNFPAFSNIRPSAQQNWEDLVDNESRESGLHPARFATQCQPHPFQIAAHYKSKFYIRLPVWSAIPADDSDSPRPSTVHSTYEIFEFFCSAASQDWACCKEVLRLALVHMEALASHQPHHEVGSFESSDLPRVFGPVGNVRVFSASSIARAPAHAIRNLFGLHNILVVPDEPPNPQPSFDRRGLHTVYQQNPDLPCDVHCKYIISCTFRCLTFLHSL